MKYRTTQLATQSLRKQLGNVEDNLYRFRHFGAPTDVTGNGETYASVIARLEQDKEEIKQAIADLEAS